MNSQAVQDGKHPPAKKSFYDRILDFGAEIGMLMIFIAFAGICWHVAGRYLFDAPINWFIDIATLLLFYITYLGSAWLLREKGHVSLDILRNFMGPIKYKKVEIATNLFCAVACLLVAYYGVLETKLAIELDITIDMPLMPPKWIVLFMIPVSFVMMAIEFFRQVFSRSGK